MPDLVLTFLLLGVPLLAGVGGSVLVESAYADLRSRPEGAEIASTARARLPVFFVIAAIPFVFGLVLWFLLAGDESVYGPLQGTPYTAAFWIAAGFAVVSALVAASQTWLARARLRAFLSDDFGRILPVLVVPNTSLVFALVLGFLALARISDFLTNPSALSAAAANQVAVVFQVYALASLGNLAGIGLSLRIQDFSTPRGFMRMMNFAEVAVVAPMFALIWGFLQLGSV